MNVLIDCFDCGKPGLLRLDAYPQHVEHPRRGARPTTCQLPPRDVPHPEANYKSPTHRRPARAACSCDTRELAS